MDLFSTPSLSLFTARDFVSVSDAGAGVALMVFALSRVVHL